MVDNFVEGERPDREILTQGARNILDNFISHPARPGVIILYLLMTIDHPKAEEGFLTLA